jgi:hypothetical protein
LSGFCSNLLAPGGASYPASWASIAALSTTDQTDAILESLNR